MPLSLPVYRSGEPYVVSPSKIICLGFNYRDHIVEERSVTVRGYGTEEPEEPILFPKTPNVLVGPGEPIVIPSFLEDYHFQDPRVDHEAELALIVGTRCRNVTQEEAYRHVFGFTCMNDVSQRNLQSGDKSGWFRGKSLDTFGPIGPRVVRTEDIGDPQNLDLECRVNGRIVQSSNTRHMIFSIPAIVAFVSRNFTLLPGDLILSGTPAGVGRLKHGDLVEVAVERIGVLRNPVVAEGRQ